MATSDQTVAIVAGARTPVGSFNGSLSSVSASYLGTVALRAAMERARVEPKEVDEVILGQVLTAGQGQNPARQASILAGIPVETPAWGVNQLCGSGLRAVALGCQQITSGDARIVAAGHSYGANTTLMVAGARVVRDGQAIELRDPRVSAAIVISAPPFYGDDDFRPILAGITIPTLHVTTADDIIRIPGFGSGVEDRLKVFDAIGGAHKVLAVYRHGTHNVFTDHRYFDSREVSEDVKRATESLSLAFIDTVYGTSTAGLAQWRSGHRALLARYETRCLRSPTTRPARSRRDR